MTIRNVFEIGGEKDIPIYLRANPDMEGRVTGILIRRGGFLQYLITWGDGEEKTHYDFELTTDKML